MLQETISAALQQSVSAASVLANNDLDFHTSLDSNLAETLHHTRQHILNICASLINFAHADNESDIELNDDDDLDVRWGHIIDVVDALLEQTDVALESVKTEKKDNNQTAQQSQVAQPDLPPLPASLRNAQDLPHPQLKFKRRPDNTDESWRPLIKTKPNATESLEISLRREAGHPYTHEIENIKYPDFVFQESEPIAYHDVESTAATWVDSKASLDAMLSELRHSREIAIDLEHHDFHSFRGFVCLMQISNRDQDWIVDTLALRDELVVLNEVFTDSSKLKVFHGANWDIIWLQRDFGLYIVNLFDTYHASKALGLEGHGLAFLLNKYVQFNADKRYQLADWRIRPLPKEMLYYARSDTHYLLYVYDIMRNQLLEKEYAGKKSALAYVLHASADVSLRTYYKEPYDAANGRGSDGWLTLTNRFLQTRDFTAQQMEVLKALHQWRDKTSREVDESTRYVMPNNAIINIATNLPTDLNSLLQANKQTSSTMQSNLKEVLKTVTTAIQYADETAAAKTDESNPTLDLTNIESFTTNQSLFWGGLTHSLKCTPQTPAMDLRLTVPMADLTEEVYEAHPAVDPVAAPVVKAASPEVFIVNDVAKQQAAKRKSEALAAETSEEEVQRLAKQAKKAARKAAKAAKTKEPEQPEIEEPFDYASQPAVLKEPEHKRKKARKFDEFKGKIVRSKPVHGGRSSTFQRST